MFRLAELAEKLEADYHGDGQAIISRARAFEDAGEGDVTFAAGAAYRSRMGECRASAIILSPPAIESVSANLLLTRNPKLAFARAIQLFHGRAYVPGGISPDLIKGEDCILGEELTIHPRVTIGREVRIGDGVTLHPGVVIGDRCQIGENTVLQANVSVYADCEIGSRVMIHAGTVIGADGFGFVADEEGRQVKILQLGRVIIEDDCEIGANCAIDRGGFNDTILRRGVKLDNLIQVGHNTLLGENSVVAALTGFSGGTTVGRNCIIAGQVGTNQHIRIGDRALITGQTGVTRDIPAGAMIGGMSQELSAWRRSQVLFTRLPELKERLRRVEKTVEQLNQDKEKQAVPKS
jgi:UDP-3-O-[3-hydroxymyristoyl] glucosamine N-acyltransferase